MSPASAAVDAKMDYLIPTSRINRRWWAPGEEYNTGVYETYPVTIRNARLEAEPFDMDVHGFCLAHHKSAVTDWEAGAADAGSAYSDEVAELVKRITGADQVFNMAGQLRTSGKTGAKLQPPAAEAHVDFTPKTAEMVAQRIYEARMPDGPGYDRFISFSLWRPLSPAPQDWPLACAISAVCGADEGTPNTKVDCDEIPEGDALFAEIPGEENMVAASIFTHNPDHRWYYYPDMSDDEVLFIKFYDSDRSRAWRCLHTAFADTSRPDAIERHSMEYRGIAYFSKAAA
jgi:hypothetical protein